MPRPTCPPDQAHPLRGDGAPPLDVLAHLPRLDHLRHLEVGVPPGCNAERCRLMPNTLANLARPNQGNSPYPVGTARRLRTQHA